MRLGFTARNFGALVTAGVLSCATAFPCGLSWNKPGSHFEGVDYQGDVFLVEELGKLEVGGGTAFPIYAAFESINRQPSPYLGAGWMLPLLEANFVQLDENTFRLNQPDGKFRLFWRDAKNPAILNGQGEWKAEIRGETITAWADCGDKITFNRGHITGLQAGEEKLNYVYSNGRVSEIRQNGAVVLTVQTDSKTGEVIGLALASGKSVGFEQGQKPQVQNIGGRNVVARVEKSLHKALLPDGRSKTFDFAVDAQLQPTIKIEGGREIAWNAVSGKIVRDGDWKYCVEIDEGPFANAKISRSNAGATESWFYDEKSGEETIVTKDRKLKRSWFPSGILMGKIRRIEEEVNGRKKEMSFSYDEKGRRIRRNGDLDEFFLMGMSRDAIWSEDYRIVGFQIPEEKASFYFKEGDLIY